MAYVVAATWRAREGEEERIREILERIAPLCRDEPACRLYQAHRSPEDPRVFFIYEQYDDEDGLAVVETAPLRPNPVTQDEMDAGSVELF